MNKSVRMNLARELLALEDGTLDHAYAGDLGNSYRSLLHETGDIPYLNNDDTALVNTLLDVIRKGYRLQGSIQALLASMLYLRPEKLPYNFDLEAIPGWLMNDYLAYMFSFPTLFIEKGDADNYCKYMHQWVNYLHANILDNRNPDFWLSVARVFIKKSNFIPLYFNESNLKAIYTERADIFEYTLKQHGAVIDYTFPEFKPVAGRKIRLGILAMHLGPMTETYATIPSFEYLDKTRFDITIYLTNPSEQPIERYCISLANRTVYLDSNLTEQVNTIRQDELDILLFTTNTTAVANPVTFLAFHRLARLQITSFNSPVTTGSRHMDYYLTGSLTDPLPNGQAHYREKLLNLDGPGFCFSYAKEAPATGFSVNRHDLAIPQDAVVFISCANFYKLIPELRETWATILADTPGSFLVLMPFGPSWSSTYPSQAFIDILTAELSRMDVSAKRLRILQALPCRADVKSALELGDIYLDSFPYSGTTSLVDPLETGLPAITKEGHTLRSRMGAAVLKSLALHELIATSRKEYIHLAVSLAKNPDLRQGCRVKIAKLMNNSPDFFDSQTYSDNLGHLLAELHYKPSRIQ